MKNTTLTRGMEILITATGYNECFSGRADVTDVSGGTVQVYHRAASRTERYRVDGLVLASVSIPSRKFRFTIP